MNRRSRAIVTKGDNATRQRDAMKAVTAESAMSIPFMILVSTKSISTDSLFKMRPTGCHSKKDNGAVSMLSMIVSAMNFAARFYAAEHENQAQPSYKKLLARSLRMLKWSVLPCIIV